MIPTKVHGVIDYAYGVVLLLAPYVLGFADGTAAQYALMVFGAGAIVYSLLTKYELGAVKLIPLRVHLVLDMGAGAVLIALPWILGFDGRIVWPYVIFGAASVVIPMLTQRHTSLAPQ